jgi:hypothetical protein
MWCIIAIVQTFMAELAAERLKEDRRQIQKSLRSKISGEYDRSFF